MKRFYFAVATLVVAASQADLALAQPAKGKVGIGANTVVGNVKGTPAAESSITLTRSQLEALIKSSVDKAIKGTKMYFGHLHGRPVEVTRKSASTIHVDLDLAYRVKWFFDPEVDVDFDVRLTVVAGKLKATILNTKVDVDSKWYADIVSLGLTTQIDRLIEPTMQREIARRLNGQTSNLSFNCTRVDVKANGDLQIFFRR